MSKRHAAARFRHVDGATLALRRLLIGLGVADVRQPSMPRYTVVAQGMALRAVHGPYPGPTHKLGPALDYVASLNPGLVPVIVQCIVDPEIERGIVHMRAEDLARLIVRSQG